MSHAANSKSLLAIVELGGYPDFRPLYERAGCRVSTVTSMRKALAVLKTLVPDVIVAEFNYQSDFRDRTSSLESLFSVVQRTPQTRVIVFYEREQAHQFARVQARFPVFAGLAHPIDARALEVVVRRALEHAPSTRPPTDAP